MSNLSPEQMTAHDGIVFGMNRADRRRRGRLARHKHEWAEKDGYGTVCGVCGESKKEDADESNSRKRNVR